MPISLQPIYPSQIVALLHHLQKCDKITKAEANHIYHNMMSDPNNENFERETAYIHEKN